MNNIRKFLAALLVMSMVLALASTALAYVDKTADKYVIFKGSAYGYKKIWNNYGHKKDFSGVVLRKGSIGHVVSEKGDWYKIEVPKKSGEGIEMIYFNKKFTQKAPCESTVLIYSTAGNRDGSGKGVSGDGDFVDDLKGIKIKTSGKTSLYQLKFAKGDDENGSMKSMRSVKKGVTVTLIGNVTRDNRGSTYFKVKIGNKKGYIPANRLDRTGVYSIMKKLDFND